MHAGPVWEQSDVASGQCHFSHVGTAKPPGFARIQDENAVLKVKLREAEQRANLAEPDPAIVATVKQQAEDMATLTQQMATMKQDLLDRSAEQLSKADAEAVRKGRERLAEEQQALEQRKAAAASAEASMAKERAAILAEYESLQVTKQKLTAYGDSLQKRKADITEQEAGLLRLQTIKQQQEAILAGDFTAITESLVLDIARLETIVADAHNRYLAVDRMPSHHQRDERKYWLEIHTTAAKELRAVKQQLIQLPRPSTDDPRKWKDRMVELVALAMENNIPAAAIKEFVSRSVGQLASRGTRRLIAAKALGR